MPQISVINQPFGGYPNRVGDHIASMLTRPLECFNTVQMISAFAKASGVDILFDDLQRFISTGGTVQIAVGINHKGTSRQGLDRLLQSGAAVYVFHNRGGDTFHPKFYLFERTSTEGVVLVGSSNLTRGGLYENFEFSVRLDHDLNNPLDAAIFRSFKDAFDTIIDLTSGMTLLLDASSLAELDRQGYLLDETQPVARGGVGAGGAAAEPSQPSLFQHVPMPRAPRPSRRLPTPAILFQPGQPVATFTMTLGRRDTRQQPGYSRDIFIPIRARDANKSFWDWDQAYTPPASGASGGYMERRVNFQVTPVSGITQSVLGVRIYQYAGRDEFRLNCSELVRGANPGDILVLSRMPADSTYDYDATVIPQRHSMYNAFRSLCVNIIAISGKQWGYS